MPHLKAVEITDVRVPRAQVLDVRVRRAATHPLDHLIDGCALALNMTFNAAVGTVSHPSADSEFHGLFFGPSAVEDPLHASVDTDMAGDFRHHTVAMSGASSAFMPITL